MKLAICSDHRGYKLKQELLEKIKNELGYECIDCGCDSEESCDFPVYAFKACHLVRDNEVNYGIVICGSGDGVCIASNKVKGIRCTIVTNKEEARRAKEHINVNVVALGAEKCDVKEALDIVKNLINCEFLQGKYLKRINMISDYENEE